MAQLDKIEERQMIGNNARDWPLRDTTALQIIDGLYRCRKHVWSNDQRIIAKYGLTWTQLMILEMLRDTVPEHTLSPTELVSKTQSTSGGVAKMLSGLESLNFIKRLENAKDQRSSLANLTLQGKEAVEKVLNELAETNAEIFLEILAQEECDELAGLLSKLRQGLKRKLAAK